MNTRILGALAAATVLASACDDLTGPGPKESVTLDFCAAEVPIWFAVQNEAEEWQQVTVGSDGAVTFDATPRVSVAFVIQTDISDFRTQILRVSRDELEAIRGDACTERSGTKTLNGTVLGLTGQQVARVSMGRESGGATTSNTSYSIENLPDGPLDLVATRYTTSTTQPPDRVIAQRGVNLSDGGTIPELDFGSAQAVPLASNTVTFANRGTDLVSLVTELFTENGTNHRLMQFTSTDANASLFVSLPQSLRINGDRHVLSAHASGGTGNRDVTSYYAAPSDRTVTFGPHLSTPTFAALAAPPYVRPRVTVASQSEYGDAMEATFSQLASHGFRMITMLTTLRFRGGLPATWELEMPDLSGAGYDSDWALQDPTSSLDAISAYARGYDSNTPVHFGGEPPANDATLRTATRFSGSVAVP